MSELIYEAKNEKDTDALGAALAEILPPGTAVALSGTLGAGKTRLVQAIAEAIGIERNSVLSPTFVLAQEYHSSRTLYHIDAYRLRDEDEFLALGPEEYFESDGITLVEWADRVENCLPREYLAIEIEVVDADSRRFKIAAVGQRYAAVVEQLGQRLKNA